MARELDGVRKRLDRELLRRLGPQRFALWVRNARPAWFDEDVFSYHVENSYVREKIEAMLKPVVTETARRLTNRNVRIRMSVECESFVLPHAERLADETRRVTALEGDFARFVEGAGNRLALAGARAFARGDAASPRSLLLHAPSGLGKTHLLGAAADEMARRGVRPLLRFTGEQFRRHFDHAVHRGHVEGFLFKCRTAAAFLLDDVHLLADRLDAQEALTRILRELKARRARSAVSAMMHPRRVEGLSPSLRRALHADAELTLEPPDAATGTEFLRARAPAGTPSGVLVYIAENVRSSHKDQLHCLARILEHDTVNGTSARAVVSEFLNRWSRGLTYADIVRAAAASFGVTVSSIYSEARSRSAADARQACFFLARRILKQPFARIGEHFGGRDHATVLQACRKLEGKRGTVKDRLRKLEQDLVGTSPDYCPTRHLFAKTHL